MKKALALVMAGAMALSMVACGGSTSTATSDSTAASTGTSTASSGAATEITLWTYPIGSWQKEETVNGFIAEFNKQYPDIKVNVEYLDYTNGDDKVTTAIEAKNTPEDVYKRQPHPCQGGKKQGGSSLQGGRVRHHVRRGYQ